MPERAALYARVSTADQTDNYSLGTQISSEEEHAKKYGYTVVAVETEDASGYTLERRKLAQLRTMAREGQIDVLVCYALDRLSRNQTHQTVLYHEFDSYGVRIELASEKIDDTSEGQFLRSALGFVAEKEREKILERTQRGTRQRVMNGKLTQSGWPTYGYMWDGSKKDRFIPDPFSSSVVRRIYLLADEGKTCREIASILNAEHILTPIQHAQMRGYALKRHAAAQWNVSSVAWILNETTYKGVRDGYRYAAYTNRVRDKVRGVMKTVHSYKEREMNDPKRVSYSSETVPSLVDEGLWERVQQRLKSHTVQRQSVGSLQGFGLLRGGFMVCGYCGSPMHITGNRNRKDAPLRYRYRCATVVRKGNTLCDGGASSHEVEVTDAMVWEDMSYFIGHAEEFVKAYHKLLTDRSEDEKRDTSMLSSIEQSILEEKARKANLAEGIAAAKTPGAILALTEALDRSTIAIAGLEKERETYQVATRTRVQHRDHLEKVAEYLKMAQSTLDLASYDEKRALLYALQVQVRGYRCGDERDDGKRYDITLNLGGIVQVVTMSRTAFSTPSTTSRLAPKT